MAVRLTFEIFGDVQLDRTLARFEEAPQDARPLWEALADRFAAGERRQFRTEGGWASGGWPALSPAYGAWKSRHYPGARILHREGELEASLTSRPLGVEVIEPGFMVLGSGVEYGRYHQSGGGNLPQRRPVELTGNQRTEWVRLMQRFIVYGHLGGHR